MKTSKTGELKNNKSSKKGQLIKEQEQQSSLLHNDGMPDSYFNEEMTNRIKESISQAKNGEYIGISTSEEIKKLLGV